MRWVVEAASASPPSKGRIFLKVGLLYRQSGQDEAGAGESQDHYPVRRTTGPAGGKEGHSSQQRWMLSQALALTSDMAEARWLLIEQSGAVVRSQRYASYL